MAKKKKSQVKAAGEGDEPVPAARVGAEKQAHGLGLSPSITVQPQPLLPQPPTLVICRNKHWRHISSYHGPWLNLPPEVLETLAYSNYYSPRPQPIDPAVFFDLVKIRRLIDDATSLSVRAANGTTAASLTSSFNSNHRYLNGADADLLGIGTRRGGAANAKLSRERKFRMREHATTKLSHAYRLDEIAASVATMQSASALEDVAKYVLQRNDQDTDAHYVHFFHEKIPSRALAESTSLKPLTDIIHQRPTDPSAYRTRAVTRVFKDDHLGAARDLTEGLAVQRLYQGHRSDQLELILARDTSSLPQAKLDEKDHPSSMEPQLLFLRAGTYLTLACQNIAAALKTYDPSPLPLPVDDHELLNPATLIQEDQAQAQMDARKLVRTYAKRALRDYTAFLSHFDYTPGLSPQFTDAFIDRVASMTNMQPRGSRSQWLLDVDAHTQNGISEALVKYDLRRQKDDQFPHIPKPTIYKVSDLFNAVLPAGLPPYPPDQQPVGSNTHPIFSLPDFSEAATYHPLLADVLHSLLLCHCLVQTSIKEHQRHAYMAARVARVCDGYPIFLAPRSPSRADWVEVSRKMNNWLGLEQTWEKLCMPSLAKTRKRRESMTQKEQDMRKPNTQSIAGRLDENGTIDLVKQDDATFSKRLIDEDIIRQNISAREAKAIAAEDEEMRKEYHNISATRTGSSDPHNLKKESSKPKVATGIHLNNDKDVKISTERAEMIVRWIREAPLLSAVVKSSTTKKKSTKKSTIKSRLRKQASDTSALSTGSNISLGSNATTDCGLEQSIESLNMVD